MKVTVEEIAKIAGVSKATVSRVINNVEKGVGDATRARVLQIIKDTNYFLESNTGMKSRSIALVIPDISNPFFSDIAKIVEQTASEQNYITIIANTDYSVDKEKEYISKLIAKKIDGIILLSAFSEIDEIHYQSLKYNIPMILLDRKLSGNDSISGVYSDTEYMTFLATEAMIKNGHKNVAFISGHMGTFTSVDRMAGYKCALQQYSIPIRSSFIRTGDYKSESGYKAIFDMIKDGVKFDGIVAANDLMALGAIKALHELGYSIPNEVEVIGCDNIVYSQFCDPPLSTIQQPSYEMGRKSVDMIVDLINGKAVEYKTVLPSHIVYRKTTII